MMQRYMVYQRAYALWKFGRENPGLDKEDKEQVYKELRMAQWHISIMNQFRRKKS